MKCTTLPVKLKKIIMKLTVTYSVFELDEFEFNLKVRFLFTLSLLLHNTYITLTPLNLLFHVMIFKGMDGEGVSIFPGSIYTSKSFLLKLLYFHSTFLPLGSQ